MTKLQKEVLEFFFDEERMELEKKEMGAFVTAPAGNGKTLCFVIPALKFINFDQPLVQVFFYQKKTKDIPNLTKIQRKSPRIRLPRFPTQSCDNN